MDLPSLPSTCDLSEEMNTVGSSELVSPELVLPHLEQLLPVSSLDGEEALVTEDGEVGTRSTDLLSERVEI